MLRPRFYSAQDLHEGRELSLETEPSRHIAKALRMRVGDILCLFNGDGLEHEALITAVDRSRVSVRVNASVTAQRESPLQSTLAIALSRGDRVDTIVQKATELGVGEIWPLLSERTGVRLDDSRMARKREHWQRIAISACEQCGRNRIPQVAAPRSFEELLSAAADKTSALRLILHPTAEAAALPAQCESLILLVGPEGGFSDVEVDAAMQSGFVPMQLGPRVLRTETAPLAALAVAQARWGDFGD